MYIYTFTDFDCVKVDIVYCDNSSIFLNKLPTSVSSKLCQIGFNVMSDNEALLSTRRIFNGDEVLIEISVVMLYS